jgi:hypothetical protein
MIPSGVEYTVMVIRTGIMSDNFLKKLPKEVEEIMFFLFNQQIEQ